jgi:hypothetical protein
VLRVADKEYYSFEEVLKDLKLEENELKRLVSAGEIRAFRDKNTMRFKAEDIARLRTSPTEPQDMQLDDLELDLDDTAAAPAEPAAPEMQSEELVLEETVVEDSGLQVEEVDLSAEPETPARGRGRASSRRATAEVVAPAAVAEPEGKDSPLIVGALIVGVVLLILANFVILDAVTGKATGLSGTVSGMFG